MEALESRESEILVEIGKICYFHSYFRRYKQTEQAELGPLPGIHFDSLRAYCLPLCSFTPLIVLTRKKKKI